MNPVCKKKKCHAIFSVNENRSTGEPRMEETVVRCQISHGSALILQHPSQPSSLVHSLGPAFRHHVYRICAKNPFATEKTVVQNHSRKPAEVVCGTKESCVSAY